MARHLNYNPGRDSIEYLDAITHGENRLYILDQLLISLRAEIGRPNHQHHLLIGPRGAGKTHLLRLLTAGRIPQEAGLAKAYLPLVMPEETSLRTPGDLLLKFVERLDKILSDSSLIPSTAQREARGICSTALTTAKAIRNPLERLSIMAEALDAAASTLGKILLPITENMNQIFYLGSQRSRQSTLAEQWALRRYFQETPHLFLIAAAPSIFGTVGDPGKPFYDFFRTHELQELTNNEVLEIIHLRLQQEFQNPSNDKLRSERVHCLLENFHQKSPHLRGLLTITGGLPRFTHLIYEVIVETDVDQVLDTLNHFLDDLTPYFQTRLDPSIFPQAEMDLLHTLALARGPQQPSELAEELYGVGTNEISELLNRLQERGLVKRAGRPGGKAVTWDLTEPLYRIWTQFRNYPDEKNLYRFLSNFVSLLFNIDEIKNEIDQLSEKLSILSEKDPGWKPYKSRKNLLDEAYSKLISETQKLINDFIKKINNEETDLQKTIKEIRTESINNPNNIIYQYKLALIIFKLISSTHDSNTQSESILLLDELRQLSHNFPKDNYLKEILSKSIFNIIVDFIKNEENIKNYTSLINELKIMSEKNTKNLTIAKEFSKALVNLTYHYSRTEEIDPIKNIMNDLDILSKKYPLETFFRESLANAFVNSIYISVITKDKNLCLYFLNELRKLSSNHPKEMILHENLSTALMNSINDPMDIYDIKDYFQFLNELQNLHQSYVNEKSILENLARGIVNVISKLGKKNRINEANKFLKKIEELASKNQENNDLQYILSQSIFNIIISLVKNKNVKKSLKYLEKLTLLNKVAVNPLIQHTLAKGLFNIITELGDLGEFNIAFKYFEELREISIKNSLNYNIIENTTKALVNLTYDTANNKMETECLLFLKELHFLYLEHSNESFIQQGLAKGLISAIYGMIKVDNFDKYMVLLNELITINYKHFNNDSVQKITIQGFFKIISITTRNSNIRYYQKFLNALFEWFNQYSDEKTSETVNSVLTVHCILLLSQMKSGNSVSAKENMQWLQTNIPHQLTNHLQPMILAMNTLEKGEDQALAREPEEMRRVVRLILEEAEKKQ
ncbi:MAG: hypothetical protein IV090_07945 [Candidatus Sericytochromatia bacterium]|nr:hypothetical protein [Candidatus Sericytochromatia bacterium]